jgi:hypothetical protein
MFDGDIMQPVKSSIVCEVLVPIFAVSQEIIEGDITNHQDFVIMCDVRVLTLVLRACSGGISNSRDSVTPPG